MGLISSAIGLVGGFFGRKAEKKAAAKARDKFVEDRNYDRNVFIDDRNHDRAIFREDQDQLYVRTRDAAENGGFNPLTALGATGGRFGTSGGGSIQGGSGPSGYVAPLASIGLITQSLQGISDEFTGVAAKQRAQEQLQYDLGKVQLDTARAKLKTAQMPRRAGTARLGNNAASVGAVSNSKGMKDPKKPPIIIDSIQQKSYDHENGETVNYYIGPDLDEMVSGALLKVESKYQEHMKKYPKGNFTGMLLEIGKDHLKQEATNVVTEWMPLLNKAFTNPQLPKYRRGEAMKMELNDPLNASRK